jgi:hypothetical protein
MSDDIDPRGWYMLLPDGMEEPIKTKGREVIGWIERGRAATYWPVEK